MLRIVPALAALFGILIFVPGCLVCALAMATPQGEPFIAPGLIFIGAFLCLLLVTGGFIYVGIWPDLIGRSTLHRIFAGGLLTVPILLGAIFSFAQQSRVVGSTLFFAGVFAFVFMNWPGYALGKRKGNSL
ncbi:hypothetical protein [Massilia phyllosphaerae]|uniref:hypothetical protein n=1 Tax=Massilia phyllosphaerae TaxID=3106034 RepID=UPI002B1CDAAB|nr:hypothetical protein [Massilia sp. SGZ-792]